MSFSEAVKQSTEHATRQQPIEVQQTAKSLNVAVIGSGLSGLVCARECLRQHHRVAIFEKKKDFGGTWSFEAVPPELQTKSVFDVDWPSLTRSVQSSLYDELRVNLPREIMGFTDFPFDAFEGSLDKRRYCHHEEVNRYIKAFVRHFELEPYIHLESEVVNVDVCENSHVKWNVEVKSGEKTKVHEFDAVVVSNGQYTVPNIPDIKNIDRFGRPCLHSHLYRNADPFRGKTVVVHGGSFSGKDIALQVGSVAHSVYICSRTYLKGLDVSQALGQQKNIHLLTDIAECTGEGELKLKEGRVLKNIDVLIFCTGYRFEFPFLEKSGFLQLKQDCVYPVYRQIFHPRYPTLAFTTLPRRRISAMLAEYQSKYIARVFAGKCTLPDTQTMLDAINRSIEQHKREHGSLKTFHYLRMEQYNHMNALAADCGDVAPLPEWREEMHRLILDLMTKFPDTYKDIEMHHICFHQAKQEFDAIRANMKSADPQRYPK